MAEWTTKGTIDKISVPSAIKDDIDGEDQFTIPSYFKSGGFGEAKIDLSVSGNHDADCACENF